MESQNKRVSRSAPCRWFRRPDSATTGRWGEQAGLGYFASLHKYRLSQVPAVTTYKLWILKLILSYVNNM